MVADGGRCCGRAGGVGELAGAAPGGGGTAGDGGAGLRDALFSVEWVPVTAGGLAAGQWAVAGADHVGLAAGLAAAGLDVRAHADPGNADASGADAGEADAGEAARVETGRVLGLVQQWLEQERLSSARLVVVTRGAVAAGPGEGAADPAGAAVWGLVRSAQSENPGRLVLVDLPADSAGDVLGVLAAALGSGEPELAIRGEMALARRLARPAAGSLVPPPGGEPWRLDVTEPGTLDSLALVSCQQAAAPLLPGQVRVAVRVAGLNFRDVLIGLGMYPGAATIGGEVAGVVTETGPGVAGLAAGDRVMGLAPGGFGPVAVADAALLARVPEGWSFADAAAVPVAFVTAWYALVDLAGARAGQRLLVHAAAGGVGMAAVAIARYLGLEVYGTASRQAGHCWRGWAWTAGMWRRRGRRSSGSGSWPRPAGRGWMWC